MKSQRLSTFFCGLALLTLALLVLPVQVFAQTAQLPDGLLIKASGPQVDRVENGLRRWIPDPTTFSCMGLKWGQVQGITDSLWREIPGGAAYPSRANGTLLKGSGPAIYVMSGCQRHWIPDVTTFNALHYNWNSVQSISDADLKAIPLGTQISAVQTSLAANLHSLVGRGFHMQTNVTVAKDSGIISAVTHTWDARAFAGFTGNVQVWLLDSNGTIIAVTQPHTFSVSGNYTGQSDRLDSWSEQLDPSVVSQAASVRIYQYATQVTQPPVINNGGTSTSIPTIPIIPTIPTLPSVNQTANGAAQTVGNSLQTVKNTICAIYPALKICKSQ